MEQSIIFFLAVIIIVGTLLFLLICNLSKKGTKKLDIEHYRARCLEIENHLKKDEPSSYHLFILNYDKLVDEVLRKRGVSGKTMGERMKNSASKFSDRNGIWMAHKLRNVIAHESNVTITYKDARRAQISFRKALKDLGAI